MVPELCLHGSARMDGWTELVTKPMRHTLTSPLDSTFHSFNTTHTCYMPLTINPATVGLRRTDNMVQVRVQRFLSLAGWLDQLERQATNSSLDSLQTSACNTRSQ
jgi:hypothetical protein